MPKPKKKITFFDEAELMAVEDQYPLQQEITDYMIQRNNAKVAEVLLKGEKQGDVKITDGLIDRLLSFMQRHAIETLSLGDYVLSRYKSTSVYVSTDLLRKVGVTEEQIEAATVRTPYETITVR